MHVPDWPVQPPPVAVQVTLSPSAGVPSGVPPLGSLRVAGKVHPPPPAQQVEPTEEVMVQATLVVAVCPETMKLKLPASYPEGNGTVEKLVETVHPSAEEKRSVKTTARTREDSNTMDIGTSFDRRVVDRVVGDRKCRGLHENFRCYERWC